MFQNISHSVSLMHLFPGMALIKSSGWGSTTISKTYLRDSTVGTWIHTGVSKGIYITCPRGSRLQLGQFGQGYPSWGGTRSRGRWEWRIGAKWGRGGSSGLSYCMVENNLVFHTYVTFTDFRFTIAFHNIKLSTACCKVILWPHKNSKCTSVVVKLPSYVVQECDLNILHNIT